VLTAAASSPLTSNGVNFFQTLMRVIIVLVLSWSVDAFVPEEDDQEGEFPRCRVVMFACWCCQELIDVSDSIGGKGTISSFIG
jgi:hypothetical protein